MLAYFAIQLVGMSLYGVESWTRRADAFGVWFALLARLAPIGRRADGRLVLRPPVVGAASLVAVAGTAAMLIVGDRHRPASTAPRRGRCSTTSRARCRTLREPRDDEGLRARARVRDRPVASPSALVGAIWLGGMDGMPRTKLGLDRTGLSRQFAHTLIPIAAGYLVAHYFSLLAYNGQDLWRLASDPLGNGSDYFGGAQSAIDYSVVSATAIWYVQVGALVAGHVAGLVLAHDRALVDLRRRPDGDAARRSSCCCVMVLLHAPRPVAAVGRAEHVIVFAHAGHWLPQLLYLRRCSCSSWLVVGRSASGRIATSVCRGAAGVLERDDSGQLHD